MEKQRYYLLKEEELSEIYDLSEGFGLAIDKIIRGRLLTRDTPVNHPAVVGFKKMLQSSICNRELPNDEQLMEIF